MYNIENCISLAKLQFKLNINGVHGLEHWLTVMKTGQEIAKTNGGDYSVVTLFGIFHDCCRLTDQKDPEHGVRAAQYVKLLEIDLSTHQREILDHALSGHNIKDIISNDPTIGACWDADKLDLTRVGIIPEYEAMSTSEGREMLSKFKPHKEFDFLSAMCYDLPLSDDPISFKLRKTK